MLFVGLVFPVRGVQIEEVEVVLLALVLRRQLHVVAILDGEIIVSFLHSHERGVLILVWGRSSKHILLDGEDVAAVV